MLWVTEGALRGVFVCLFVCLFVWLLSSNKLSPESQTAALSDLYLTSESTKVTLWFMCSLTLISAAMCAVKGLTQGDFRSNIKPQTGSCCVCWTVILRELRHLKEVWPLTCSAWGRCICRKLSSVCRTSFVIPVCPTTCCNTSSHFCLQFKQPMWISTSFDYDESVQSTAGWTTDKQLETQRGLSEYQRRQRTAQSILIKEPKAVCFVDFSFKKRFF